MFQDWVISQSFAALLRANRFLFLDNMKIYKLFFGCLLCLLSSCSRSDVIELETHVVNLKYDVLLENQLSHLGLVDMTKLPETLKQEIEELQVVRLAEFPSNEFVAQIVLMDANNNGRIEYDSIDMVGLSSSKGSFQFMSTNFIKSAHPILVNIGEESFELNLKEGGSKVELVKMGNEIVDYDLTYPYILPKTEYKSLTKGATLDKNNGKYTYVEFWGTWCKPCIEIVPEIKQLKEGFDDRLNIVGVNYRDQDMNKVKHFILNKKMNWDHILANEQLLADFGNPKGVPFGVLFDPQGKLIQYGIFPDDVRGFMNKSAIIK